MAFRRVNSDIQAGEIINCCFYFHVCDFDTVAAVVMDMIALLIKYIYLFTRPLHGVWKVSYRFLTLV